MATEIRRNQRHRSRRMNGVNSAAATITLSISDLWQHKREYQRKDINGLESGTLTSDDVNWFAGGLARKAKLIGSLF